MINASTIQNMAVPQTFFNSNELLPEPIEYKRNGKKGNHDDRRSRARREKFQDEKRSGKRSEKRSIERSENHGPSNSSHPSSQLIKVPTTEIAVYITPALTSLYKSITIKFTKSYISQVPNLILTHKLYYKNSMNLNKVTKTLVSGCLLEIHSPLFQHQICHNDSTICLPSELDPESITSILDYLHGFQLQMPPEDAADDLYAAAAYFRLYQLKFGIMRKFSVVISIGQFKAIDEFVSTLPTPKVYGGSVVVEFVGDLPHL